MSDSVIPAQYQHEQVEDKWYQYWESHRYFHSEVDTKKKPFTVVIPPPNVTGVLHMGHMLNNTIQDVLVRKARMDGYNACWVPGTDHASIATEAKVVRKLREEGIKKSDLSRDAFMEHSWEWTHKHGGIILEQLKKLGASCDWDRTHFTMNPKYSESVIDVFIDLYKKGKIYRDVRMINWDPAALTALSDEEVIYKEVQSQLYYIRYRILDEQEQPTSEYVLIATTRPETLLGDSAVCIHPEDTRFKHLQGAKVQVPIVNRAISIIADDYVDPEFGTGCLKVTPAHDLNDYELGKKYDLDTIDIINPNGSLNELAGTYEGMDRFEARKQIVKDLDELGLLEKTEQYTNKVGFSERTDVVIEPRLSLQWWVSMKELSKPALDKVMDDTIAFHPAKFKNTYRHWMENIKDWCISRQLWWGHQIPAYYYGEGEHDFVVAKSAEEALLLAQEKSNNPELHLEDLTQDQDVLDTWFSSWLWPISVFEGFYDKKEVDYYYPTQDLVTAPEIMFFWVARMIIAGYEYRNAPPFENVYFTGIVRDKQGRKMSKSLGNSPDPLDLIAKFGADGVRMGMLFATPAGNDLPFDDALCAQGRKFSNKIWNAFRFLTLQMDDAQEYHPHLDFDPTNLVDTWIMHRLNETIKGVETDFKQYRINDALKKVYALLWDDFCDWYIELNKSTIPGELPEKHRVELALGIFEQLMKLLHPFMPFISEEIWQYIQKRDPQQALCISSWPSPIESHGQGLTAELFEQYKLLISSLRNIRAEMNISPKKELHVGIKTADSQQAEQLKTHFWIIEKLEKVTLFGISTTIKKPTHSTSVLLGTDELYVNLEGLIDIEKEKAKITDEIARLEGFLKSIQAKLSNTNFVENAPKQVVDNERKKEADTLQKLQSLAHQLTQWNA